MGNGGIYSHLKIIRFFRYALVSRLESFVTSRRWTHSESNAKITNSTTGRIRGDREMKVCPKEGDAILRHDEIRSTGFEPVFLSYMARS